MLIRIRSKNGIWRIDGLTSQSTIADVKHAIHERYKIAVEEQRLSNNQEGNHLPSDSASLQSLRIGHGDILYLNYSGPPVIGSDAPVTRTIKADGSISHVAYADNLSKNAFRPGLKPLRDMKMHWTLGEFMRMDAEFEFRLKAQKSAHVSKVSLDSISCDNFQSYLRQFAFQQSRCAWLYGTVNKETKEVFVDFIYEPPQEGNPFGFQVFDDVLADKADAVANALGRDKVGWVFSHPPREEENFHFSSREILMAAQLQMDAGGKGSLFVSLNVTLDKQGQTTFEAYQVSDQCLDMFASGALLENNSDPKVCGVHETFTAIVEGKAATSIDNNFFLCVVPVESHQSNFKSDFPKPHREGIRPSRPALASYLQKYSKEPYLDRLRDFHLLLFLSDFLDISTDIPAICRSLTDPQTSLDSGYPILIDSIAGRTGAL